MSRRRCVPTLASLVFVAASTVSLPPLLSPSVCRADRPSASYIFPAGGQRGTTVSVSVGGHYLHEECPFVVDGPGIKASATLKRAARTIWFEGPVIPMPASQASEDYPKDQAGTISIEASAPLGARYAYVSTSQGSVPGLPFVVGDLPEIVEQEIDGSPIPTLVSTPVTINGRIFPREDVDVWTVSAQRGQTFTCEVMAARIGSPLDSRLEIRGPDGQRVADSDRGIGRDARLRFTADQDGLYHIRIHDLAFGGLQHYVYRLTVTTGPVVDSVFPLGGQRGTTTAFELTGQSVPSDQQQIALPEDAPARWLTQQPVGDSTTNPFLIELGDDPEIVESVESKAAAKWTAPTVLNGRISEPGETDEWTWMVPDTASYAIDVRAARLRSPLDAKLSIHDETGKELAQNSDQHGTDPALKFQPPQAGKYTIRISDEVDSRAGKNFAYRLCITPVVSTDADFALTLPGDSLTVDRGKEAKLKIKAERRNGFDLPIPLTVSGLPEGVTVKEATIAPGKSEVEVTFQAEETARVHTTNLRVEGRVKREDDELVRIATIPPTHALDVARDSFKLAVAQPTPFTFGGSYRSQYAARGSTFWRRLKLERNGFEGPITVQLADRQIRHLQGVTGRTIVVPPGESEFDYPIHLPSWMEIGRTSRTVVMAIGEIKDPDGTIHKVSFTSGEQSDQIIVLVAPSKLTTELSRDSIRAAAGTDQQIDVTVNRANGLEGDVEVRLLAPRHVDGVDCGSIRIPAGENTGTLEIQFANASLGPFNQPLIVRATIRDKRGEPIDADTPLVVVD